jgi:hypothetical protein
MLQTTNYKQNDVITLKLVTGEEVIGLFIESSGFHIKLKRPVSLVAMEKGVGFAPFAMSADPAVNEFIFKIGSIITDFKTSNEYAVEYGKIFKE